ncbi:DUF1707 domain-containing protein [Conexibacter stalactiti]|uniref:DUF1707 domain-containing protein n=1 Tax=Conexibacter stalactiti TaxID=1940611 RepID=A0ABU4HR52_9ACTN|nr:DUF1707 domain-containing protein [Conexibacter stalactiti]MDW5595808.1 DUF1707 domain-containing protein [Conexibacter stalactiti]MEC5036450.1 DUF1707 domain-containing protein [Conexibacter stalactiti]
MSEPEVRASDAEREQTVERLRSAAGEGRLTLEELSDRIEAASGARTRGELARLTGDLPPAGELAASGGGAAGATVVTAPVSTSSVFGDHRRAGAWQLPASSRWRTVFGDIKLDLREARVPAGEITIDAGTVVGDVELLVPEGVIVEVRSRTFLGEVKQDAGMQAPAGAPRIVLTGSTVVGDVRVRARRLRERLAQALLSR